MNEPPPRSTSAGRTRRLLDAAEVTAHEEPGAILYTHTVFCQTGLPYRNPGKDMRRWERVNGKIGLQINVGETWHPGEGRLNGADLF